MLKLDDDRRDEQILDDLARHLLGKIGRHVDDFIKLCKVAELSPLDVLPKLVFLLVRLTASIAVNEYVVVDEAALVRLLHKQMCKAREELAETEQTED